MPKVETKSPVSVSPKSKQIKKSNKKLVKTPYKKGLSKTPNKVEI